MLQPQSDDEVRVVVEALRRLDPLLDVIWNPKARMVKPGDYTVLGKNTPPEYEGLFDVIRYNTPGLHDRNYVVLCRVTKPTRYGRRQILMMESDGPYWPVGEWLVECIRTHDKAQVHLAKEIAAEVDRENERIGSVAAEIDGGGAHQEAAEKVYHQAAGAYWMGRGADLENTPKFGKGKRTSTAGVP